MLSRRNPRKMSIPSIVHEFGEVLNGLNNDLSPGLAELYESRLERLRAAVNQRLQHPSIAIGSSRYAELVEVIQQMDAGLKRPDRNTRKDAYLELVSRSYDSGAEAAVLDASKRLFRKPAKAASDSGITVLSAAGAAFIRGYLDNYPSALPAAV